MTKPWPLGPPSRVMLIAPHPDDETLATGGLLQQAVDTGAAIRLLFLTAGENNPWAQMAVERRWRIGTEDKIRWAGRRRQETLSALSCLGVPEKEAVFLEYPDQGITDLLLGAKDELAEYLAGEFAAWRPTLLITPSLCDQHPDHSAAAVFVKMALARLGPDFSQPVSIEYLVHTQKPYLLNGDFLALALSEEQQNRKRQAIHCHASQLIFRRHGTLAFANKTEKFLLPSPIGDGVNCLHPVRQADLTADELRLKLELSPRPGAFGRATLYLASNLRGHARTRISMVLPRWPGEADMDIRDLAANQVIARGKFDGNYYRAKIKIPRSLFGSMDQCFVKLERRFGFFDEAGWRELPVSPPSDRA